MIVVAQGQVITIYQIYENIHDMIENEQLNIL